MLFFKWTKSNHQNIQILQQQTENTYLLFLVTLQAQYAPQYATMGYFFYTLGIFVLSLLQLKTLKLEAKESGRCEIAAKRLVDPIQRVETMKSFEIKKCVELIKNYKFISYLILDAEVILLSVICAQTCTILTLPYLVIAILFGLVMAIGKKQHLLCSFSNKLNLILIALLLVDLITKYLMKAQSSMMGRDHEHLLRQLIGLLSTTPSYVDFYLKLVLLQLECQKLNYSYDYQGLLEQMKLSHQDKPKLASHFKKKNSFSKKFLQPISLFIFCTLCMLFALCRPSILLLTCMPLFIYGYFKSRHEYQSIANVFAFVIGIYILCEYVYNILILVYASSQNVENWVAYIEEIFGFERNSDIYQDVFPFQGDFILFTLLAFFAIYIKKSEGLEARGEEEGEDKSSIMHRSNFEGDEFTFIPDDVSMSERRSVRRQTVQSVRSRNQNISQPIQEEDDGYEEEENKSNGSKFLQNQSNYNRSRTYRQQQAWHQQQDQSLRGKISKFMYRIYSKLTKTMLNLRDLIIIHWMKLSMLALFFVSVSAPTLFNFVLFTLFLLIIISSLSVMRKLWKVSIIFNSFIIISMYAYDVFFRGGMNGVDPMLLEVIGLIADEDNTYYIRKYYIYLALLLVQTLNHYVIYSKKYEEMIQHYNQQMDSLDQLKNKSQSAGDLAGQLQQLDKSSQSDDSSIRNQSFDQFRASGQDRSLIDPPKDEDPKPEDPLPTAFDKAPQLTDSFSRFMIKISIYLLMAAIWMECLLIPVTFINLILQLILTIIIHRYLHCNNQIEMYKSLYPTLYILKYSSLVFVFAKYVFQFIGYAEFFAEKNGKTFDFDSGATQQVVGIENTYVPLKLFAMAMITAISHNQLAFLDTQFIVNILQEQDKNWDRFYFLNEENKTPSKINLHKLRIYALFFFYHLFILLPIIMVIVIALSAYSVIGCLFLITTIILMYRQREEYWENSYKVLSIVTSISIIIVFVTQIIYLYIDKDSQFLSWLGLSKVGDMGAKHPMVFSEYVLFSFVYLACIIQRYSQKYKSLFVQTTTKDEVDSSLANSFSLSNVELSSQSSKSKDDEGSQCSHSNEKKGEEDSDNESKKSPSLGGDQELILKKAIYLFEEPIRQCLRIRDHHLRIFLFSYGVIIMQFMALVTMMYKLNVTSIIYSAVFVIILKQNYYPIRFVETIEQRAKRLKVSGLIKLQITIISVVIIEEYAFLYGTQYIPRIFNWEDKLGSSLCFNKTPDCIKEWGEWLSLQDFPFTYIIFDHLYLFVCYITLLFTTGEVKLKENQIQEMPVFNDRRDFINGANYNKYYGMLLYFLFMGFPTFFISYLFILATTFHARGMTDIISVIYLFFAFYYFLYLRRFYTRNTVMLAGLRIYNLIIFYSILIFQIPLFICPIVSYKEYAYISKDQCLSLVKEETKETQEFGPDAIGSLYVVFTSSLGLFKSYKNMQMNFIFMMVFTEIQNHIFHHPFFKVYVLEHMYQEREADAKLRGFMFVERCHLTTLWCYKSIKEEIKILHHKLMRINKFMRDFSVMRGMQDETEDIGQEQFTIGQKEEEQVEKSPLIVDQNEQEEHKLDDGIEEEAKSEKKSEKQQDLEDLQKLFESHYAEIENKALEIIEKPDQPVIPLKLFMEACKEEFINQEKAHKSLSEKGELGEVEESMSEKLVEIVYKLQKQVYYENKRDLYFKDGIGLNFAIQKGSIDFLKEDTFKFYHHLIFNEQPEERFQRLANQNQERSSIEELNEHALRRLEKQSKLRIQKSFDVSDKYEERLIEQQNQQKDTDKKKDISFGTELLLAFRSILYHNFIDKLLLYSFTSQKNMIKLEKISLVRLLGYAFLSQSQKVAFFVMFINFVFNTNLLSLILPLSVLLYAMLDHPLPHLGYWKYLILYMFLIIATKFMYQFPIFCSTPPYSLYSEDSCSDAVIQPEVLVTRIDYIIGIHKFAGPASAPRDRGTLHGIFCDLLVLFCLLLHKNFLIRIGVWHYVKVRNHIYLNPSFKCKPSEMTENEQIDLVRKENFYIYNYQNYNLLMKAWIKSTRAVLWCKNFFLKLMPMYLSKRLQNSDLRYQQETPQITHKYVKVKPGRNFFAPIFFTLLILLFFVLFFFKNVTGESQSGGISDVKLTRFTLTQVFLLFFILCLMVVERMLFRSRLYISKVSKVSPGFFIKHALTIKLIIHSSLVLFVHVFYGFIIPASNHKQMSNSFALVFFYMLWALYFVFSALQIKYGFPQRPFKPHFTKDTSALNVNAFRVYKAIPFLWEMKVIIDWTVTKTSLDLFQWFKIDDAFNYLYYVRYQISGRLEFPEYGAQPFAEKFIKGFCFAVGLIIIIIGPILLFSEPAMIANPVNSGVLSIALEMNSNGNQYNILTTQGINIQSLTSSETSNLKQYFNPVDSQFDSDSLQKISFSPYSETLWTISPPALSKFITDFYIYNEDASSYIDFIAQYSFERENPVGAEDAETTTFVRLNSSIIQPIIDTLEGTNSTTYDFEQNTIQIQSFIPKFFRLGSTSEAEQMAVNQIGNMTSMTSVNLTLNSASNNQFYWTFSIADIDQQGVFNSTVHSMNNQHQEDDLVIVFYNEEVIGNWLGAAASTMSVLGLYATIVVAIGGWIRLIFDRISQRIIYEEIPDPEKLFEICEGIFISQLEGDLVKEKRLYNLLIKIYRSPETIMKMTGSKLNYNQPNQNKSKPKNE